MDFVSAIWGKKYALAGRGLARSFAKWCPAHRLVIHTDVPELLPPYEETRNVVYQIGDRGYWLDRWHPYWRTGGREMIVKLDLLRQRLEFNGGHPVTWVDGDVLFADDPQRDLGGGKPVRLVVKPTGRPSSAFWGVSTSFQLDRLQRWAHERVEASQDFSSEAEQPLLDRWWLTRRHYDTKNVFSVSRLYDAFFGERMRPAGDGPERLYAKTHHKLGGIFVGPSRVCTLRLSADQIAEHQSTAWRAFQDDNVRKMISEYYKD